MRFEWITRACPLCGSAQEGRVFAESTINLDQLTEYAFASRKPPEYTHPRLVECGTCGLLYGNPVLSADSLTTLYREAAFDSREESVLASLTYQRVVERYLGDLPDRVGAIDVGAGDGAFCERLLELGFSGVVGIEPSAAPVAAATPEIKRLLTHSAFRAEDFAPSSVSLVCCFQVMEHVSAPRDILMSACSVLKPKGLFLAIVHDQQALPTKILGTRSPIYDIEHLQLFTKESGRRLLESVGLERVQAYSLWNRYSVRYWSRLFPFPPAVKRRWLWLANATGLGAVQVSLPAGNLVLAGFKP